MASTCIPGAYDCNFNNVPGCAPYNNTYIDPQNSTWIVIGGGILMAIMAFGMGANDTANSWGTSIGSKAITIRNACIIGGLADWLGAMMLGGGVSGTIQKGVAPITDENCWACGRCDSVVSLYAVAMFGALVGASMFLMLASFSGMPVSTTHAIVGGLTGPTVLLLGGKCLNWNFNNGLAGILTFWLITPLISGFFGITLYYLTNAFIFNAASPRKNALLFVPFLYALSIFALTFLSIKKVNIGMSKGTKLLVSLGAGVVIGIVAQLVLVPIIRRKLPSNSYSANIGIGFDAIRLKLKEKQVSSQPSAMPQISMDTPIEGIATISAKEYGELDDASSTGSLSIRDSMSSISGVNRNTIKLFKEERSLSPEQKDAMFVFRYVLILVAALESFAHGANDTGNATAAFSAILQIQQNGLQSCGEVTTPLWILAIAGFFIFVGVNVLGYRVMRTIGAEITYVNMHRGFCMELSTAITVVVATAFHFPVSTTHCQVGSVVLVSLAAFGSRQVSFRLFGKIFISWLLTVPFSGFVGGAIAALLKGSMKL